MARANRINTKLEIIATATRLFLEKGYSNVVVQDIAKEIGISQGNLTFHFPTKEHLITELIKYLCDFQWQIMEREIVTGNTALAAYLFEITAMAASCYDDAVAKDMYVSAYTLPMCLRLIRQSDTKKVRGIFSGYCPDWEDTDFVLAENIASGIEYSMFTTEREQGVPLARKLAGSLNAIMLIYNVPDEVRKNTVQQVLELDYENMGRRMLREFNEYVESMNQKALEEAKAGRMRSKE